MEDNDTQGKPVKSRVIGSCKVIFVEPTHSQELLDRHDVSVPYELSQIEASCADQLTAEPEVDTSNTDPLAAVRGKPHRSVSGEGHRHLMSRHDEKQRMRDQMRSSGSVIDEIERHRRARGFKDPI
jgi:hypothetical protein